MGFEKAHAWPIPTGQMRRARQTPPPRPKMRISPGTALALACPAGKRRSARPPAAALRRSSLVGRSPVSSCFEYSAPPKTPQANYIARAPALDPAGPHAGPGPRLRASPLHFILPSPRRSPTLPSLTPSQPLQGPKPAPSFSLLLPFAPPPIPQCSPPFHPQGGLRFQSSPSLFH
jgi:hypothetical protein